MNCPNCSQPIETGAVFCGNCGAQLRPAAPATAAAVPGAPTWQTQSGYGVGAAAVPNDHVITVGVSDITAGRPGYAFATQEQHTGETKALLSLIFGILSLVSLIFVTLLSLGFGIAGIAAGTMSRSSSKRGLSTAGMILSGLALLGSLAVWGYALKEATTTGHNSTVAQKTAPAVAAASLSTPCYSVNLVDTFNVSNAPPSCNMSAYSGTTLADSSNAYKIYANSAAISSESAFSGIAKQALEKDVKTSLPGFGIDTEQAALFAGSPAYYVHVSDKNHGVAVVEAAVYHKSGNGVNVFILVHALAGTTADLNTLEAQWQWK